MRNFLELHTRYGLKTNITEDKWMQLVYNYPDFPVSESNLILHFKSSYSENYVGFGKLDRIYYRFEKVFNDDEVINFLLVSLYISLGCSVLLFSFRVTSGKSWLWSFVSFGVLWFIYGILWVVFDMLIFSFVSSEDRFFHLLFYYWGLLFVLSLNILLYKWLGRKTKNRSGIVLNLFLWLIPIVPCFIYWQYLYAEKKEGFLLEFFENHPTAFYWGNLIFVILIFVWVVKLVKSWKALPED